MGNKLAESSTPFHRLICAIYLRLSKEDDKGTESASIETQRKILTKYVRDHGFILYDEYIDDGYSGTTMDRPDFNRLLTDIEAGKINIVITKDLSRLGRNSGRVNLLIDEYFPEKRVRYISISEGIDTAVRSNTANHNLVVPIHNFTNEFFAADTSNKIHLALMGKMEDGDCIKPFAPYGYKKDPLQRNRLIIDEPAAKVVRRIFQYAKQGHCPADICKILNSEHILPPLQYRFENHPHIDREKYEAPTEWRSNTISRMLRDEVYLGHLQQGKTLKPSFKSSRTIHIPKEDWVVAKNKHEAIVDTNTWKIVRKRVCSRTYSRKGFINIFSGIAKCADCGKNMSTVGTRKKGATANLACGGYKSHGKMACSNHFIDYDIFYMTILKTLQQQICLSGEDKSNLLKDLLYASEKKAPNLRRELADKINVVNHKLSRLFDDHYSEHIEIRQFETLLEKYSKEKDKYESHLNLLEEEDRLLNDAAELEQRQKQFQEIIDKYDNLQELTSDLLFELIDRINVHQGNIVNGVKEQQIDIFFKFRCTPEVIEISY